MVTATAQEPGTTEAGKAAEASKDVDGGRPWGMRLEHRLAEPLVYLSRIGPGAMDPLLNDPILRRLLGHKRRDGSRTDLPKNVLRSLASLLSRNAEDLELALTNMVPSGGLELPNLIFRCRLDDQTAGMVRGLLAKNQLARAERKLFGQQVYGLSSSRGAGDSDIEVVMVGRDLLISNDSQALRLALDPQTSAVPSLSTDKRFTGLKKDLAVPEGAVMLYANWSKLGHRLSSFLEGDGRWPFRWSGLRHTDRVLLVTRPHLDKGSVDGFVTTILLTQNERSRFGGRGPGGFGPGQQHTGSTAPDREPGRRPPHLDGWLDLVEGAKPRQLLPGLSEGNSFVSLAVALDPEKLLPTGEGPRMRSLQGWLFGECMRLGLDVKRQVKRLGKNSGLHVKLLPGEGLTPRVAYSFLAKSKKAARDLFQDLRKPLVARDRARAKKLPSGNDLLEVDSPGFGFYSFHRRRFGSNDSVYLAVIGDALYFTFDESTMAQVEREVRGGRKTRGQDAKVMHCLRHLGARDKQVAGLFAADLGVVARALLENVDKDGEPSAREGETGQQEQGPMAAQSSALFGVHAGYFTVEPGLIRFEVFSPR